MRRRTLLGLVSLPLFADDALPPPVRFIVGPINSVIIGGNTAVYSAPPRNASIRQLLVTHARRDAIGSGPPDAQLIVPEAEKGLFANPKTFWETLETARFHDYAQRGTKVPVRPWTNIRAVAGGEEISVPGATVRALATPGYTRSSISYVVDAGGKRVVCTGDLIYAGGKILDLYSLQDAVPEAKARGYHGYAARAGALIASLRKVADLKPDIVLPARGPMIPDPERSIARLIDRLQRFLQSHFETDALRWYWGDENHRIRSAAVERTLNILPMAEQATLPADILAIGNSRLILSKTGEAFLVDAGYSKTLPELRRLRADGKFSKLAGIWITHYHDDHTEYINDVAGEFRAPVYFTRAMADVMANPARFRLPCLTTRPVSAEMAKEDGETVEWNEWHLTFWNFPGQTLYHGGLVARRGDGQAFLFVGDSFTPSGMDDYCMQNRNFLRKDRGYDYCLRRIAGLPSNTWLLNQHVQPMFRYTPPQVQRMQDELTKRAAILDELSPWPDINFMTDESWARIDPYGIEVKPGQAVNLSVRITNHASKDMRYGVKWNVPAGWKMDKSIPSATIGAGQEGELPAAFRAPGPGLYIVTADVSFGNWRLPEWTEAMVRVE